MQNTCTLVALPFLICSVLFTVVIFLDFKYATTFFFTTTWLFLYILLRNWIQATFILGSAGLQGPNGQHDSHTCEDEKDKLTANASQEKSTSEEIDLSEDFNNMFGTSHNLDEVTFINLSWVLSFVAVSIRLVLE